MSVSKRDNSHGVFHQLNSTEQLRWKARATCFRQSKLWILYSVVLFVELTIQIMIDSWYPLLQVLLLLLFRASSFAWFAVKS